MLHECVYFRVGHWTTLRLNDLRLRLLAIGGVCLLLFGFGIYKLRRQFPANWANILIKRSEISGSTTRDILAGLRATVVEGQNVRAGAIVDLATFVQPDGGATTVTLIEGTYTKSTIEPTASWKTLGEDVLLVNSVDERQSLSGGISGQIGEGCGLPESDMVPLNLGDVALHPCTGAYRSNYGIRWVANLAIIVWDNPNRAKLPCWNNFGADLTGNYRQCVKDAVTLALSNLFRELHTRRNVRPRAIVFPGLGTGTGHLDKDAFYDIFFDRFYSELTSIRGDYNLPDKIYLQTFSGEEPSVWAQTATAIARNLSEKSSDWNYAEHKNDLSDWASVVGIAGALALITIAGGVGVRVPLFRDSDAIDGGRLIALLVGWFSAALGLTTITKSVIALLPRRYDPWPQIAAAFIVVLLTGPLLRASKQFETAAKEAEPKPEVDRRSNYE
jgi:hypothetical protein